MTKEPQREADMEQNRFTRDQWGFCNPAEVLADYDSKYDMVFNTMLTYRSDFLENIRDEKSLDALLDEVVNWVMQEVAEEYTKGYDDGVNRTEE